jgi:hypothetical protein
MMRPLRPVDTRSRCRAEQLHAALDPSAFDADPFDLPEPGWFATTTEDVVSRAAAIRRFLARQPLD